MRKNNIISHILAIASGALLLVADQITKQYVSENFVYGRSLKFINGLIGLNFIHNTGGAWGVFSGYTWLLLAFSTVLLVICIIMVIKSKIKSRLMFWGISLIAFGGIGNTIDRISNDGKVVDFLQFEFWPSFPVFNIADCGIVIGTGILILYFILDFIKEKRESKE